MVGLQALFVDCADLESLAGLPCPDTLNTVILNGPALKDLGELAPISAQTLFIPGTGLENLDALAALQLAGNVTILDNPQLVDAGTLDSLLSVDAIDISNDAALEHLPELSSVARLGSNPSLQSVALGALAGWTTSRALGMTG